MSGWSHRIVQRCGLHGTMRLGFAVCCGQDLRLGLAVLCTRFCRSFCATALCVPCPMSCVGPWLPGLWLVQSVWCGPHPSLLLASRGPQRMLLCTQFASHKFLVFPVYPNNYIYSVCVLGATARPTHELRTHGYCSDVGCRNVELRSLSMIRMEALVYRPIGFQVYSWVRLGCHEPWFRDTLGVSCTGCAFFFSFCVCPLCRTHTTSLTGPVNPRWSGCGVLGTSGVVATTGQRF